MTVTALYRIPSRYIIEIYSELNSVTTQKNVSKHNVTGWLKCNNSSACSKFEMWQTKRTAVRKVNSFFQQVYNWTAKERIPADRSWPNIRRHKGITLWQIALEGVRRGAATNNNHDIIQVVRSSNLIAVQSVYCYTTLVSTRFLNFSQTFQLVLLKSDDVRTCSQWFSSLGLMTGLFKYSACTVYTSLVALQLHEQFRWTAEVRLQVTW